MPSILKTKALASGARVIRYLNKYGFSNIKLTIYIMDIESSLDQVVALEPEFIDTLKPNLNVDLIASSSGLRLLIQKNIPKLFMSLLVKPHYHMLFSNS